MSRTRWTSLDPPATVRDRRRALSVARAEATELARKGATSVVLAGSWARGDAHRESDVDLWVFGRGPDSDVRWRGGFMVTRSKTTESAERRKLRTPPHVGGSVPGWKIALALHDPLGIARRLRSTARAFRWEQVAARCDRWVADQLVGWAEEVVKTVRALATGDTATAAVQRNLLADHLGFVMAIHRREFWDSENGSWERIARRVGGAWERAQRGALGLERGRTGLEATCRSALTLYARTAETAWRTLKVEQRSIVIHACEVAGTALTVPSRSAGDLP